MASFHFIRDDKLEAAVRTALKGPRVGVIPAVSRWLVKQPTAPDLVGSTVAASILGVQPPHLARLREQERMPEPIPVEGSNDVYLREEVQALAKELQRERAKRKRRRSK